MILMDDIEKIVKEFKEENGNKKFNLEDIVIYAIKRIDVLPCQTHSNNIATNKAKIKMWNKIAAIMISINTAIQILILNCIFNILH